MKKALSVLLCVLVMLTTIPLTSLPAQAATITKTTAKKYVYGDSSGITRAEWLHNLNVLFDLTVEEDNYPDVYYSDITSNHKYYHDIMIAIEYGLINVETSGKVQPDKYATREFASQTMNFCLGFKPDSDEKYTFADSADILYPDDAQVAVNHGWFGLSGGKFVPSALLTESEAKKMIADAESVISNSVIDTTTQNKFVFADNVVVVPQGTVVDVDENMSVTIFNNPKTINVGDTFVVYEGDLPSPFIATSVTVNGNKTIIKTSEADIDSVLKSAEAEGIDNVDSDTIEPAKNVKILSVDQENKLSSKRYLSSGSQAAKSVTLAKTIKLGSISVTLNCVISNVKAEYSIKKSGSNRKYMVAVKGNASVTSTGKISDLASALGGSSQIDLCSYSFAGIGKVAIALRVSVSGSLSVHFSTDFKAGIEYTSGSGIRIIRNFTKNSYSVTANLRCDVSIMVYASLNVMSLIKGNIHADFGGVVDLTSSTYGDGKLPKNCTTITSWLYVTMGASASIVIGVDKKSISKEYVIYDENNSPARTSFHYEDGRKVNDCARGDKGWRFRTSGRSRYGSNGYTDIYSTDYDDAGKKIVVYKYSLDKNNNATITKYNGNAGTLIIPETIDGYKVVGIGSKVFKNRKELYSVVIPDTVTKIESYAFENCTNLKSLDMSTTINTINTLAFSNTGIERVYIPKSLETIGYPMSGNGPFANCSKLKTVEFEKDITSIPSHLFASCSGLESINIPNTVTKIESYAFENCTNLKSLDMSTTINTIGTLAFSNTGIERVYIPKSLETIGYPMSGNGPFANCSKLKTVEFEKDITSIPSHLFASCSGLESINIPNTVTKIESYAFADCTNLKLLDMSTTINTINTLAFSNTGIERVYIPKSLENIQGPLGITWDNKGPFANCSKLKTVEFEKDITSIPKHLFAGCSGLESINIPNTVTKIESYAFSKCSGLKSVLIPNSVTVIDDSAFISCVSLQEISVPDSVAEIGTSVFENCTSLVSAKLPSIRKNITDSTFKNCTSLKKVEFTDSVTAIRASAFYGCSSLESINLSKNLTEIGGYSFYGCSALKTIDIPKSVKIINNSVFSKCNSLKDVVIPSSVKEIGNKAFAECALLKNVTIPKSVKTLGSNAFSGCEVLENVNIADYSITEIKDRTFKDCPALKEIVLPKGLTSIGSQAFMNDTSFVKVTIPESVTSIATNAFSYPEITTFYGYTKSYAKTFADKQGFKFVDNHILSEGIALSEKFDSYNDRFTLDVGGKFTVDFELYPKNSNDVITLTSDNKNVTISSHTITGRSAGNSVITATATSGAKYKFYVHVRSVSSISLKSLPTKTRYVLGEDFDNSGLEVQINYGDKSTVITKDYTLSGYDKNTLGKQTITVTYTAKSGSTYKKTFEIEVVNKLGKKTGISIEKLPNKTSYEKRESFDSTGLVVVANYDSGAKAEITDYTLSGYNALKTGKQTITVTHDGFTATFTVTVGTPTEHTHQYTMVITKQPSCTEKGIKTFTCYCGESYTEEMPALGHAEVVDKAVAPTCTETGLTEGKYCSVCRVVIVKQTVVPAKGHIVDIVGKKSATYFASGYTGDSKCKVCNNIISKGKTVSKLILKIPAYKFTGDKKKLKVTYKKVTGATGFQVRYRVKGKYITKTYTANNSVTKTISLKKGSYSIQIRAMAKQGSKTAYSDWTKAKTVKVK